MAFSSGMTFSTRPFIDTLIIWYVKGVQVVQIWTKFHLCLTSDVMQRNASGI